MKEFWKNLKDWQRGGILVGVVAVIVIVVVAVIFMIGSEPKVEIEFGEQNNIPGGELRKVRGKLVDVIRNNTENFDSTVVYRGVASNYKETTEGKETTANFVVDFDSISESYKVSVTWPDSDDGSPNIVVSCALLNGKYPETACTTESNSSSDIVGYLPYIGEDAVGEKYKITANYDGGNLYLEIKSNGNIEQAVTAAKEWLKKLDFDPDDYLLYAASKQYVQVNHAKTKDTNVNKYLPYFIPTKYYIYPVVDDNNNITSIHADLGACTDTQVELAEKVARDYLSSKNINYPIEFGYCAN